MHLLFWLPQVAYITLHIQIMSSHFAQLDWVNVVIMNLLPEVPVVVMQQQEDFLCVVPAKMLNKSKAAGIFPFAYKQAIHGHRFWACLMCSAVWNGCSLQCQHTVKPPHPSHLEPFFTEMFAWAERRSLSPWGAPNVTNQMWTEKYINTVKTTWTQLVVALNKKCLSCNKTNCLGFEQASCVFI